MAYQPPSDDSDDTTPFPFDEVGPFAREDGDDRVGVIDARIGEITLKDEFSDPSVDISHERETADHEIVTGHDAYRDQNEQFVVQALGRKAPEIEITGWLTEEQASIADDLVSKDTIDIVTSRYIGSVVPRSVDIPYSRVFHDKHGWIFEVTFDFLGVRKAQGSEGPIYPGLIYEYEPDSFEDLLQDLNQNTDE